MEFTSMNSEIIEFGILYMKSNYFELVGYSDADFGRDV